MVHLRGIVTDGGECTNLITSQDEPLPRVPGLSIFICLFSSLQEVNEACARVSLVNDGKRIRQSAGNLVENFHPRE